MTLFARRTDLPPATAYSVVDEHTVIHGEIATEGTIRIDGRLDGRMHRADTLIVGRTGTIVGDIEAREVVVAGAVQGNILADGRVEVQPTGSIRGDVRAPVMRLEEGGTVQGHVVVVAAAEPALAEIPRLELARNRTPALPG
ncbi:MAG TPA: polymer-forming cytoskeletal protein [Gemmatimonadaceae bacterium]|nr:polymer-forming cytoskeletal protein [Gemmatimonadaceae bacterium]